MARPAAPLVLGRYALFDAIAAGGMATVHIGRLLGPVGFARTVAIKRMHPHLATSAEFVAMFTDEARVAGRIRHGNVVSVLDVVAEQDELFLVMEYVHGESLATLCREAAGPVEPAIASAIAVGMLAGLHAAHEAKSDQGKPLDIVHRDVSPQNVLVGVDGIARLSDFGIAKAIDRLHETRDMTMKGKIAYVSPEQLLQQPVDRRADVYSASITLWEMLVGERLHAGTDAAAIIYAALEHPIVAPSALVPGLPKELDAVLLRGLSREPEGRFATAQEMALAIESIIRPATSREVVQWVEKVAGARLTKRAQLVATIESESLPKLPTLPDDSASSLADLDAQSITLAAPMASTLADTSRAKPRGSQRAWLLVAGVALLSGSAALAARTVTRSRTAPSSAAAAVIPASAPSALPDTRAAITTEAPPAPPEPAAAPPARPAPARKRRPPPPANVSSGSPAQPPAPGPAAPNCESPLFIDSTGFRRPRPECFSR